MLCACTSAIFFAKSCWHAQKTDARVQVIYPYIKHVIIEVNVHNNYGTDRPSSVCNDHMTSQTFMTADTFTLSSENIYIWSLYCLLWAHSLWHHIHIILLTLNGVRSNTSCCRMRFPALFLSSCSPPTSISLTSDRLWCSPVTHTHTHTHARTHARTHTEDELITGWVSN